MTSDVLLTTVVEIFKNLPVLPSTFLNKINPSPLPAFFRISGMGGSATMVSSLCMTANFVKINGYGGGSIYSTVTFTDKLISGGVVVVIQQMQCEPKELCPNYYRDVLGYVCGGASVMGLISLISFYLHNKKENVDAVG